MALVPENCGRACEDCGTSAVNIACNRKGGVRREVVPHFKSGDDLGALMARLGESAPIVRETE